MNVRNWVVVGPTALSTESYLAASQLSEPAHWPRSACLWGVKLPDLSYSNQMKRSYALSVLIPLWGCATTFAPDDSGSRIPPPTAEEVIAHVGEEWSADYSHRFATFASRRGDSAELLSVTNVTCGTYYGHPDCRFDVKGKFADGSEKLVNLSSTFMRDQEGRLKAVILLVH